MDLQISFSHREADIIRMWADSTIHGGHFGDGDAIFPDEQRVLDKLDSDSQEVRWTGRNLEIILIWAEKAVGGMMRGRETVNIDESRLLEKIRRAIGPAAP